MKVNGELYRSVVYEYNKKYCLNKQQIACLTKEVNCVAFNNYYIEKNYPGSIQHFLALPEKWKLPVNEIKLINNLDCRVGRLDNLDLWLSPDFYRNVFGAVLLERRVSDILEDIKVVNPSFDDSLFASAEYEKLPESFKYINNIESIEEALKFYPQLKSSFEAVLNCKL